MRITLTPEQANLPGQDEAGRGLRGSSQPYQKIDHYELREALGTHQGCQHYLAQDWQTYQQVILRFPQDSVVGGRAVFEHFQREIAIVALLRHPAIQRYLNRGKRQQEPYLVLEYLPGKTLRKRLHETAEASLPVCVVLQIMTPICEALAFAHAQGIVHRGIKPEHIVLLEDGSVKLTGFGIAEWLGRGKRRWTKILAPVGTPDYLAPELWWGHPGSVQSDIYALGIVLYELLCGRTPFAHLSSFSLNAPQLSFDPPDILSIQPTLSPALATVVMRAIRRNPAKRYASMNELLKDLLHQDQVIPVTYRPERPLWGGRYRALWFIALLVLAVLAGLVAFGILVQLIH